MVSVPLMTVHKTMAIPFLRRSYLGWQRTAVWDVVWGRCLCVVWEGVVP